MSKNYYDSKRKELLEKLWSEYKDKLDKSELKTIVERNYVYSTIPESEKNIILVVGINPSFRINEKNTEAFPFSFNDKKVCEDDQYYKRIKQIVPEDTSFRIEYTDLFYYRATKQEVENEFLKDDTGLEFMAKQLCITRNFIEEIQPKLIVVFNKGSWKYWGKEYNERKDSNVWMGYTFSPNFEVQSNNRKENEEISFLIEGFRSSNQRVCNELKETILKGIPIYFSKHLAYLSQKEKDTISEDLRLIIESIKSKK